jgi:transposase InsO family protein
MYETTHDAGLVCRRCGISRPTLRKWWNRYRTDGFEGLNDASRRPHRSPTVKVTTAEEQWIMGLRRRNLGARRIQGELRREHHFNLSLATIHKVLVKHKAKPLLKLKRKKTPRGYVRPIPGDRVQMDTMKIAPGIYQYTAVDDCTRYKVLALFQRRIAANTLTFIDQAIEEMPFPIQRIQTDRGREFFAYKVQEYLMECGVKFRPNKPRSPHLNGKVERAQKTDLVEFYATVDPANPRLARLLGEWQHFYNWFRPHGGLKGKTPHGALL